MPVDKFGRMSDLKTKDTGVSLTYINNNYVRSDGETPLTGSLDMRGNTLYNVADPVNPQDVVTKVYVDNTKGSGVIGRKVGDAVSIKENLDFLGKQKIKNLPDPVNDHDAVTKKYVDEKDAVTKEYVDEKDAVTKEYVDEKDAVTKKYVDEKDAVTKKYVDDKTKNLFIDENNNIAFGLNVDMEGNQILGLPEPVQDEEPATKKYVDDLQTQYIDKRGNVKFDRNINVGNNRIFAVKDPKKDYEATNKKYVDDTITKRLQEEKDNFLPQDPATKEYVDEAIKGLAGGDLLVSKEGVFIKANGHYRATASLDIDNNKMENLPDPVDEKDAVNKKYIDGIVENLTLKQGLIRENGGFNLVDSYINMNFNNIRNLGLPKNESDAVPRNYLDSEILAVKEQINKRKQLITVYARYCGFLKKGEYHFKFNGSSFENCEELIGNYENFKGSITGFIMPHSGHIKKIIYESLVFFSMKSTLSSIFDVITDNIKELSFGDLSSDFTKAGYVDLEDILKKGVDEFIKKMGEYFIKKTETTLITSFGKRPFIFQIVKFEKSFNIHDYPTFGLNGNPRPETPPKIISTVLTEKMEQKILNFQEKSVGRGIIQRSVNNDYISLSEGDVINIKSNADLKEELIPLIKNNKLKNIDLTKYLESFFSGANFNFTFLIELDPL